MTNLFHTTFENGDLSDWRFTDARGQVTSPPGWQALREADGRWVLEGKGHNWANLAARHDWGDFVLRVRLRVLQGGLHLNYRINSRGRYFIGFNTNDIAVLKSYFTGLPVPELGRSSAASAAGVWHWVQIAGRGGFLSVMVDGAQRVLASDPKPILYGSIAFEGLDDCWVQIAEVSVTGPPSEQTSTSDPNLAWVRTGGPLGGIGYDVRVDPSDPQVLYVTDAFSGVSKSTNGGAWWFPANEGIISRTGASGDSIPVFCLTIDPRNPRVLWCGTQGMRGIYKSIDGAGTWVKCDQGIPDLEGITFRSFTIDPVNSDVVYAGTETQTPRRGPDGQNQVRGKIFRTLDGGKTWGEVLDCGALVRWMAIDPSDTRVLYAATGIFDRDCVQREGILKSLDGGKTWRHINDGLPNLNVGGLVMDPRNHEVLYAATGQHGGFGGGPLAGHGGAYKTVDGGEHWMELLQQGDGFPITAIALAPAQPGLVYAAFGHGRRFFRSSDGGERWKEISVMPDGAHTGIPIALTVDHSDARVVYLNSYVGGVFKSIDGGETWHISSAGYTGAQMWDIAMDPAHPALVYASGRLGVAKSEDGGNSWSYLASAMKQDNFIEAGGVSVDGRDPSDVLLASRWGGRIVWSNDGGRSWRRAEGIGELPGGGVSQFARFAGDPKVVYAAANATFGGGAGQSLGVLKSTDGGRHWQAINAGLIGDLNINAITVHPIDADRAYAGALNGGVYYTKDGGKHWHETGGHFARNILALAISPLDPRRLFAGAESNGLFASDDAGRTWEPAGAGLDPNASITTIKFDPLASNVIWVADLHTGVYRSLDGGRRWVAVNRGLCTRAVKALAISADGQTLYAATDGEGVFRLEIKAPRQTAATRP
ncbi:MAG: WD40/YVTN/BNR-like repeat-containing protein [Limisphaerales bacterium]